MKIFQIIPIALLIAALSACGPSKKPLSAESKQSLRTVSIESEVELPKQIWFHGKTQSIASNFGLLGSLIGDDAKQKSITALETTMQKNNVSVSSIVQAAFRNEMKKHTPFKPLDSGSNSDANLVLDIDSYGFTATGISDKFSPHLVVIAEMQNNNGDVIWRNKGAVTSITKQNKSNYTYEQMLSNPDVMREMLQTAANMAAKSAMADLYHQTRPYRHPEKPMYGSTVVWQSHWFFYLFTPIISIETVTQCDCFGVHN